MGHFGDVLPSQYLGVVLKKLNLTQQKETRHRANTSMYSLTFCVRITTPTQYGRNGMVLLQITSRTQQVRRFYRWRGESSPVCVVRAACAGPGRLLLGSATHFHSVAIAMQPVHQNFANPLNSAKLGGIPYQSPKLHLGPCNSVGMRPRTNTQTHRRA